MDVDIDVMLSQRPLDLIDNPTLILTIGMDKPCNLQ